MTETISPSAQALSRVPSKQPANSWYAEGAFRSVTCFDPLLAHAEALVTRGVLDTATPTKDIPGGALWLDVTWRPADGVRAQARVTVSDDRYSLKAQSMMSGSPGGAWTVAARASTSWGKKWLSPVKLLLPRTVWPLTDLALGILSPVRTNVMGPLTGDLPFDELKPHRDAGGTWTPSDLECALTALLAEPWSVLVVSHSLSRTVLGDPNAEQAPVLANLLPPSTYGRVFHMAVPYRALGALRDAMHRAKLPKMCCQGSVMILSGRGGEPTKLCAKDVHSSFGPILAAVDNHETRPVPVRGLMKQRFAELLELPVPWESSPQPTVAPVTGDSGGQEELKALRAQMEEMKQQHEEALAARVRAEEETALVRAKFSDNRLRTALAIALREKTQAQQEAEETDADTTEMAREITWLRGQLAATGRAYAEPVPELDGPRSWDELLRRAAELPHVVLTRDVAKSVDGLREYKKYQAQWIQRAWEVLGVLDAYGQARRTHPDELKGGLQGYLQWPRATKVISRATVAMAESEAVTASLTHSAARTFPVPVEVNQTGEAYMAAHIRIGSVRAPAPRLYFLDHTGRNGTGRIYVGYLGRHLRTNTE